MGRGTGGDGTGQTGTADERKKAVKVKQQVTPRQAGMCLGGRQGTRGRLWYEPFV